jgi:hypothetical protein
MNKIEAKHRYVIKEINASCNTSVVYYKDAKIDPAILPLVKILNSPWTVTAHSCEGHWNPPKGKPALPHVSFFVIPGKDIAWERVLGRCWKGLARHVNEKATIEVVETRLLPRRFRDWMGLYFRPADGRTHVSELFRNEKEFREIYDHLIMNVCRIVKAAMRSEG